MATFVDTNVIVYAFDVGDERKCEAALQLLGDSSLHLVVSAQVLNEFYWTVTRRLEPPFEAEDAHDVVRHLAEGDVVPIDASLVDAAIALARRHRLALWDAAILAAARRRGCDELLTEDMSDGGCDRGRQDPEPTPDLKDELITRCRFGSRGGAGGRMEVSGCRYQEAATKRWRKAVASWYTTA